MRRVVLLAVALVLPLMVWAKRSLTAPEGVTVMGVVTCQGVPVEGVTVSDGALFTQTDKDGAYYLRSLKFYGSVFVITPSGYEPVTRRNVLPQFWAPLQRNKMQKVEQHDFELRRVDNTRHRVIFTADMHFSSRNEDMLQFKRLCIPALKRAVAEVRDSIPTYSVILGDMCRNDSWYSQEIDPTDALAILTSLRYPAMAYTVMGENEYDGAIPAGIMTDHEASELYATSCAPRFYSFNIGDVHYVVIDTTLFRNDAGDGKYSTEIVGKRNFDIRVTADCLAWLRRDLALVEDKATPIVLCMHHGALRANNKGELVKSFTKPEYTDSLVNCVKDFSRVHFVSAHNHQRRVSVVKGLKHITEHSVGAIGGIQWESAYNHFPHITRDGAAAGFEVFDWEGRNVMWYHNCVDHPAKSTFRAYDMNAVGEYYRTNEDVRNFMRAYPGKRVDYGGAGFENSIYINYWGNEPKSKLEVWEGDKPLKVKRIYQDDPIATLSTAVVRHKNSRGRKISVNRNSSQCLFVAKADSAHTTIRIRTTDPFGRIYTDSLVRPVAFKPMRK